MVKKDFGRKEIIKVTGFVVLATIAIFAAVIFLVTRGSHAPSALDHQRSGKTTIRGVAVCLPHRNTEGPQTLECAIGIKDDKETYYSLSDKDPSYSNISNIQTGNRYEIIGNIEERADPKYRSAGVVRIEKVSEL